jgi:hypothetical protein
MILGADNQNKNLRIASNIKVDSTAKTRTANHYAAAVSSSKTSENSQSAHTQRTTVHDSKKNINDGKPDPVRGSMEGLDKGKSAYLQFKNSGYDNRAIQTARNSSKTKNLQPVKGASFLFTNQSNQGIMNSNYSGMTSPGSSSDRLNKGLNLNRYL